MAERYLGLMSGTSLDGIDAVLIETDGDGVRVEAALCHPWPDDTAHALHTLCTPGENEIDRMGVADNLVAREFAAAAQALLDKTGLAPADIRAIGSHGQTIRHRPQLGFTLQIGNSALLAALTGIDVISDFRSLDMALGGQGAPLVPAFHQAIFAKAGALRVVLNLGGIANISVLPANASGGSGCNVYGFDTGPANTLLDGWYRRHQPQGGNYDAGGQWGASGQVVPELLDKLLSHPYFAAPAPKSTGREMFTLEWLDGELAGSHYSPVDVQRTLQALSCHSIARQLPALATGADDPPPRPSCLSAAAVPTTTRCWPSCLSAVAVPIMARCWPSWRPCCPAGASPARPSWGSPPTGWKEPPLPGWRSASLRASQATCPPSPAPADQRYWVPSIQPEGPRGAIGVANCHPGPVYQTGQPALIRAPAPVDRPYSVPSIPPEGPRGAIGVADCHPGPVYQTGQPALIRAPVPQPPGGTRCPLSRLSGQPAHTNREGGTCRPLCHNPALPADVIDLVLFPSFSRCNFIA